MVFIDVIGPDGTRTVAFPACELSIGSAFENDLQLDHEDVAAHHVSVIERGGRAVVLDSGASPNGTLVNGRRIEEATVLSSQCQVGLGPFRLSFRQVDVPVDVPPDTVQTVTQRLPPPSPVESASTSEPPISAAAITPRVPYFGDADYVPVDTAKPPPPSSSDDGPATEPYVRSLLRASNDPVELEFLRAILEDEDGADARVVYADWLEEQNQHTRAEYMRLLDELRFGDNPDATEPARLRMLGRDIAIAWRAAVAPRWVPIERCPLVSERYRAMNCPKTWGAVPRGSVADVRRCAGCTRHVQYVTDIDTVALSSSTQKNPVVIDPTLHRSFGDLEPRAPMSTPSTRHYVIGRRPETIDLPESTPHESTSARFFADCAALEAAAVTAFERLANELRDLGAPRQLVRRALDAACEETRHARVMKELIGDDHEVTVTYARTQPDLREKQPRRPIGIAHENAVEGCVRETYGALVAAHQATRASSTHVRSALTSIAIDERSHAELSWDVARWIEPRLTPDERVVIMKARVKALEDLRVEVAIDPSDAVMCVAGYPSAAQSSELLREVEERVATYEKEIRDATHTLT